jgi:hypothetical protein
VTADFKLVVELRLKGINFKDQRVQSGEQLTYRRSELNQGRRHDRTVRKQGQWLERGCNRGYNRGLWMRLASPTSMKLSAVGLLESEGWAVMLDGPGSAGGEGNFWT